MDQATEKAPERLVKVRVTVQKREGFTGYFAVQQFFLNGTADYDIPERKVAELLADTGPVAAVVVPEGGFVEEEKGPTREEVERAHLDLLERADELDKKQRALEVIHEMHLAQADELEALKKAHETLKKDHEALKAAKVPAAPPEAPKSDAELEALTAPPSKPAAEKQTEVVHPKGGKSK